MKRFIAIFLVFSFMLSITSCSGRLFERPAKCAAYKDVHTKTKKDGKFKKSKSKSNLFPKKMRKKN